MGTITQHPIAQIFPALSEKEFGLLKESIEAHGQRVPITLWRGAIIDGVHRARACDELRREPLTQEFQGEEREILPFVIDLNMARRHMSESQRAMVAARVANMRQGARTDLSEISEMSQPAAAALFNVSVDLIGFARKVQQQAEPEIAEAVDANRIAVSHAARLADAPPDYQRRVAEKLTSYTATEAERLVTEELRPLIEAPMLAAVIDGDEAPQPQPPRFSYANVRYEQAEARPEEAEILGEAAWEREQARATYAPVPLRVQHVYDAVDVLASELPLQDLIEYSSSAGAERLAAKLQAAGENVRRLTAALASRPRPH